MAERGVAAQRPGNPRAMRLAALAAGALLVSLVAAVWLLPAMLDWNRYRELIASLAGDTLGQPVRIRGNVSLALLPQPVLSADDVTVAEGEGVGVTARQLRLRVALWPLLSGHVDAQDLVLRGVDMRVPWPPARGVLSVRAPDWLSGLSARIEDGRLSIGDAVFTNVEATLATGDFAASYLAGGTAQFGGRSWRFNARLTRPALDGSAGLDLAIDGQGRSAGLGLVVAAQIAGDGAMTGRVSARGPDLSQILPAPSVPFRTEGRLSVAGGLAVADELAGEIGGAPVRGAVALRLQPAPRLDLALAASRLDLDAWLPALLRGSEAGLGRFPVGIDLSVEAASFSGGLLRGLRAALDLEPGAVQVRELRATLPGEALLQLAGRLAPPDRPATRPTRFDGQASLAAPDLRATWGWAEAAGLVPAARVPPGVLRSAELKGHLIGEPGQLSLDGLSGRLDGQALTGALLVRGAARPVLRAALSLDRLELDPWTPSTLPSTAELAAQAIAVDLDIKLDVREAVLRGRILAPVSLDVGTEPGRLLLRRLDLLLPDGDSGHAVQASLSGVVLEGGRLTDARLDLRARQAADLVGLWPDAPELPAGLRRLPASLQVSGSGMPDVLSLRVAADLGDLRLEAQPTLDLPAGKAVGRLTLRHPGAPRLAEALGWNGVPAWLGDGSFSLLAQVVASPGRLVADSFDLGAGALHATGALTLECCDSPKLTGRIAADTLPLPLPYLRAPDPLPLAQLAPRLAAWQAALRVEAGRLLLGLSPVLTQAAGTLTLGQGTLRLEGLQAKAAGGTLAASASLDLAARPPTLAVTARLADAVVPGPVFDLPLDLTSGVVDATATLTATGYSPAGLLASLGGDVQLAARDGVLAGLDLGRAGAGLADADVQAALAGGSMAFDRLDAGARISLGRLSLADTRLTARSGTIAVTGGIDLPAASADLRLTLRPALPDPPEFGLRLSGRLDTLTRAAELAPLIRWRAEHVQ